ncbi:MAG TPA: hypothetical protein VHW71_08935 [Steroidobacteraceae bacterium]|jgi:hypothetical protein|nr:hypothetical protein [Steroidobacteraceae bacterium]
MLTGCVPYPASRRKPVVAETVVDFSALVFDLRRAGHAVNAIAIRADISRTAVRNYMAGTTPLHPMGERLLRLWTETTGNARELAPKITTPLQLFKRPGR